MFARQAFSADAMLTCFKVPGSDRSKEPCMHTRLVTPLRNVVVLLASFFLLAVG